MVIVEKNKKLSLNNYETLFIVFIIIISFIMLFVFSKISEKQIYELKKIDNGNYNITGFVSDLKVQDNYTKFKLNDSTDSINVIANYKINDLNNGSQTNIICNLQTTQYGKICYIKK